MKNFRYVGGGAEMETPAETRQRIKRYMQKTHSGSVFKDLGRGGLYDLESTITHYQHPILMQSICNVSAKTVVAKMAGQFHSLGADLLNSCINDMLAMGAKPMTLLAYLSHDQSDMHTVATILSGLSEACIQAGVSLIGEDTSEINGRFSLGERDLVGIITGLVEKDKVLDGRRIRPGDLVVGFNSNGLHTHGYALARKLLFERAGYVIDQYIEALGTTLAKALLVPHLSYTRPITKLLAAGLPIHGMAHIAGGGLLLNLPRILPVGTAAYIDISTWQVPPLFQLLVSLGELSSVQAHEMLNMGIGWIVVLPAMALAELRDEMSVFDQYSWQVIGEIKETSGDPIVYLVE